MFIDNAKIHVIAGNGGNGRVSFHKEKYVVNGGPDGGDGGRGGSVIFIVDEGVRTLVDFRYQRKYKAESGKNGGTRQCSGKGGEDIFIKVPAGTLIKDEASGKIIADLKTVGQSIVVAKGGKGGAGNQHFATATRQIPNFAKAGEGGQELWVLLEIKLLADAGLVGFPNAGKSTVLSMVSAATPKIDNYPFTTITPNLGVVRVDDSRSFVLADIPGLIEGAHEGVGLGHEFLKHIERTKLLIHVVDVAGTDGRDPVEDYKTINIELEKFNPILSKRPQVVAANKIDVTGSEENIERLRKEVELKGYKFFEMSAAINEGIKPLVYYVMDLLEKLPETLIVGAEEEYTEYTAKEVKVSVRKEGDIYIVEGDWARRIVIATNFESYDALQYFQRAMKKMGIIEELEKLGINEGDTVKVHDFEFEFIR